MGSIIGIPSTRLSNVFIRQRVTNQMLSDQLEVLRLQTQLSTGRRIQVPSEDSDAALRIISLQRLLERKEQVQTNLQASQSYLTATDTALGTVSGSLAEARGVALGAIGDTATDDQRRAAAIETQETIRHVLDAGNTKFRDRYLFAGTGTAVRPFQTIGNNLVQYSGDEGRLSSYSDIEVLADTNLHGSEVFGAVSQPVLGTADLDPIVTFDTLLSDLRGGLGISLTSITISDGTDTATIDLTSAATIGDVAALIHDNSGALTLDVEITPTGLTITAAPGDQLTIRDPAGGTTAEELGIATTAPANTVASDDLDPVLSLTTRLDDVLGTRAYAVVRSAGADNDVIFESDTVGAASNGIQIVFDDDPSVVVPGIPGMGEVASYDATSRTLTVTVKAGKTEARHVVAAVQAAYALGNVPLTARLDPLDEQTGGREMVDVPGGTVGQTDGGSGTPFDKDSGLEIVNGNETHIVSFADAETVEDLLNAMSTSSVGVLAEINSDATGIDVRSRISGSDFMVGENGGNTATQLGLRTFTAQTRLDELDYGRGAVDWEDGGTPASAAKNFAGENNGLVFSARETSPAWNGFAISFEQGVPPGTESLTYDRAAKTMVFGINPGSTTANDVRALLENTPQAAADFTVRLDPTDGSGNDGTGPVVTAGPVTTSGAATPGVDFTIAVADGTMIEIDLSANGGGGFVAATDTIAPPEASGGSSNSYAAVTVESTGLDNGLIFKANNLGGIYNDTKINFQENAGAAAEVVTYTAGVELTFDFDPGVTTAQEIIDALEVSAAAADFSATLDPTDGSPAETIGDVLGLINQDDDNVDPSTGRPLVQARLATYGNGIELVDLSSGSGEITVTRSDSSRAAIALGLIPEGQRSTSGGTAEATAGGRVDSPGADNDLVFTAVQSGATSNVQIVFNPTPGGPIALSLAGNVLTVDYDPGVSTAGDIVAAAAADPNFTAALATTDNAGSGSVDDTGSSTMAGGSVNSLATATVTFALGNNDLTFAAQSAGSTLNGTVISFNDVPGGPVAFTHDPVARTLQIDYDSVAGTTAQEIVDAFRRDPLGAVGGLFSASLSAADGGTNAGTGYVNPLNLPATAGGSLVAPATVTVTFPGLNNDLTFTTTPPDVLANNGIQIIFREVPGGPVAANRVAQTLTIDFDPGVTTAQDIVVAMAADPDFVVVLDPADGNNGTGFVATATPVPTPTTSGGSQILTGSDGNPLETEGIFTALVRLHAALKANDLSEISRAIEMLDEQVIQMNLSRAELGVRQQGLESTQFRLQSENVDIQAVLSQDLDADLVEVISNLTARQIAFEASMKSAAGMLQLTLLDYL